jgi:hypothetical protein
VQVEEMDTLGRFIVFKDAERPAITMGSAAPNLSVPMTDGGILNNASLQGKVAVQPSARTFHNLSSAG